MSINASQLRSACVAFAVPIPPSVLDAEAVIPAGERILATVRAETPPDLNDVTAKTASKVYEQAVTWLSHVDRARIAEQALNAWRPRVDAAWRANLGALCPAFRTPFDLAVADFAEAYTALTPIADRDGRIDAARAVGACLAVEYQQYAEAGAKLTQLGALREMFASELTVDLGISGGGGNNYPLVSRVASIPDRDVASRLPVILSGLRPHEVDWYAKLLRTPGVVVKWQTREEQPKWLALGAGPA